MEQELLLGGRRVPWVEALGRLKVRPVKAEEEAHFKALLRERHYLGLRQLVGETILHVAELDGQWVAVLAWCSAALKVTVRDEWIGWTSQQKQRRLRYVAQNARFLLLTRAQEAPNLGSRVLALSVRRLGGDWLAVHGHRVVLAETFVDGARFRGTCYRAAGWTEVGQTAGYGKHDMTFREHGEPKQVLLRPLFRGAEAWLVAPFDAPFLAEQPSRVDLNRVPLEGSEGLLAAMRRVRDTRGARGKRHSLGFVLGVAACGVLAGMRGYQQVADFAAGLPVEALRRLGGRPQAGTGRLRPPSEPTIRRTLTRIDIEAFERELGGFLAGLGLHRAIAIDGKTLRGSGERNVPDPKPAPGGEKPPSEGAASPAAPGAVPPAPEPPRPVGKPQHLLSGAAPGTGSVLAEPVIDGKTLRGSDPSGAESAPSGEQPSEGDVSPATPEAQPAAPEPPRPVGKPQHLLVAVAHGTALALAEQAVGEKTNEIPKLRELLAPLDIRGTVITADAMHTQTETAQFIVAQKGADYVLTAKDNQKTLHRLLAAKDWRLLPRHTEREKGHGRIERRTIQVTDRVAGLRFPHAAQGFRVERDTLLSNGKRRHEVVFGLTSLALDRAGPEDILLLVRGHWIVEAVHYKRDVTFDEDRHQVRKGNGPQAMAALRNLAIGLIKTFIPGTLPHGQRVLTHNLPRLLALVGA